MFPFASPTVSQVAYYQRPHYHDVDTYSLLRTVAVEQQHRREEERRRAIAVARQQQRQRQREQIAMVLLLDREREIELERQRQRQRELMRQRALRAEQERRKLQRHREQQDAVMLAAQQRKRDREELFLEEPLHWMNTMTRVFEGFLGFNEEEEEVEHETQHTNKKDEHTPNISTASPDTNSEAQTSSPTAANMSHDSGSTKEVVTASPATSTQSASEPHVHIWIRTYDPEHGWRSREMVYPETTKTIESTSKKETTESRQPQQVVVTDSTASTANEIDATTATANPIATAVETSAIDMETQQGACEEIAKTTDHHDDIAEEASVASSKQGSNSSEEVTVEDVEESDEESEDEEYVVM